LKTYQREFSDVDAPRAHPWTDTVANSGSRYHDFKARPELVRTAIEDFTPWGGREAVETFYRLLEWLNARDGVFESNDCEFTGPHDNPEPAIRKAQECSGRVMILYRNLLFNLSRVRVERIESAMHRHLAEIDPEFAWGAVGTTLMRTQYLALPVPKKEQMGYQLMLSFWAWGDTVEETMAHLDRVFVNLSRALRETAAELA